MSKDKERYLSTYLREHGPAPLRLLAAVMAVNRVTLRDRLKLMQQKGLVHVAYYIGTAPYWADGAGKSARLYICRTAILEALEAGPRTCKSLAAESGYCLQHVMREVTAMHEDGVLHVADWRRESQRGPWTKLYGLGKAADAARPAGLVGAERCAEYRQRARGMPSVLSMLM